jgi:hypothetical protein
VEDGDHDRAVEVAIMTDPSDDDTLETTVVAHLGKVDLTDEDLGAIQSEIARVIMERVGHRLPPGSDAYAMYRRNYQKYQQVLLPPPPDV